MDRSTSIAKIAHNIMSPYNDITILDFYKGYYDCVYVILHPFIKEIYPGKLNFTPITWPTKEEIIEYTQKVSWGEFLNLSGISDLNNLDIALRNSILGLNKQYKNDQDSELLNKALELNNLIRPGEGAFSVFLENDMLNALIELGHEWIYIGDEFGFERKIEFIQDIIEGKATTHYAHETWYTTMNEVLFATDWDGHFTFLCSDKQTVEKILEKHPFEGFYCTPDTKVYWSIHSKVS